MSVYLPPATKLRQGNIFSSVFKDLLHAGGGECLTHCMLGYHPRDQTPLWDQTPPTIRPPGIRHPPRPDPLWEQIPPRPDPPGPDPVQEIWATSGRYASYWNAILFCHAMKKNTVFAFSTRHVFIQKGYIVQVNLMVCWSVVKLALKDHRTLYNIAWNGLHLHRECDCGGNMTPRHPDSFHDESDSYTSDVCFGIAMYNDVCLATCPVLSSCSSWPSFRRNCKYS